MKLTEKTIAALDIAPGQKDRLVFDDLVRGLGLRITQGGGKVFLVQYQTAEGRRRRLPIGPWGSITLDQARLAARAELGKVASGRDPYAERAAARETARIEADAEQFTLKALVESWCGIGLANRSTSYKREAARALSFAFHSHWLRRADALERPQITGVLDKLVAIGKSAMAARTLAYGRACFAWALKRGRIATNPFAGLPAQSGARDRDRVLTDEEVGAAWRASDALGHPFGPLIKLLLLTGQRRDEVAGLRWSELTDAKTWMLPASRSKNRTAHVVHLAPAARALLDALPRLSGCDLIFTTNGRTAVSGFSKAKARLDALMSGDYEATSDWRIHDFRRTMATWLAGAGFSPAVADKILNHKTQTGLTSVGRIYQRQEYVSERQRALEAWAEHVERCASGKITGEKVLILPVRR